MTEIAEIIKEEWPRVLATLVGDLGNLSEAEDAAQDAAEQALTSWPTNGIPDRPGAWLTTVARRRAIDRLRRASRGREKTELAAMLGSRLEPDDGDIEVSLDATLLRDEQLRLLFACCHPSLKPEVQMALTLRSIGGLTTAEIARAFLLPEPTIGQRLVRAKKKIVAAGIPFKIPPDAELLTRTDQVRSIIYLIFNEGYDASSGDELLRVDLCHEAIRLAVVLVELTPDDAESHGLLALLQLIHARQPARTDGAGDLVLLADQDRSCWNEQLITRGTEALGHALRLGRRGPYQIQAAINALHDEVTDADDTDWEQIELLYRELRVMAPTPVVVLNHSVAVSMTKGPAAALAVLDDPNLADALSDYRHFHSTRGHYLVEIDPSQARRAYETALNLTGNDAERRFLEAKIAELVR